MSFKQLSVTGLKELMSEKEVALADVRDALSYQHAHIENAQHLHDGNIAFFMEHTERDMPVVVYCFHGHSSQGAARYLSEQGFGEVYSLDGGFTAWEAS